MNDPRVLTRAFVPAIILVCSSVAGIAQVPMTCQTSSAPLQVRAEGRTERLGSITIECGGGAAGTQARTNLAVFLDHPITNRLSGSSTLRDAVLSIDQGSGLAVSAVRPTVTGPSSISFNGIDFAVPASRRVVFQISELRADVSAPAGPVTAFLNFNGPANLTLNSSSLTVGQSLPGLITTGTSTPIQCAFSVLPSLSFNEAIQKGTFFFTVRATEGFATALVPRETGADVGTRLLVRYTGFPRGSRLAVPDVIAGSGSVQPTSAGALGATPSPGQYTPGSLLLVRILGTGADGAGGFPVPASGQTLPFGSLSEVNLANGAGLAVYEVADANPSMRESAQIPSFLDLNLPPGGSSTTAMVTVSLGPVGDTSVPRFANVIPTGDCFAWGDCSAGYFPSLFVDTTPISVTAVQGSNFQVKYIPVRNESGGTLVWNARVDYRSGSNWLRLESTSGLNSATLRADIVPRNVAAPGTYQATITIDAGPNGTRAIPVTLIVQAAAVLPGPVVQSVSHGAISTEDSLVPGGLAVIRGSRFNGGGLAVKLGGLSATITYSGAEQINLEVPAGLAGKDSAELLVSVDGITSPSRMVKLKPVLPGVFAGGIINSDGTANSPAQPAKIGSAVRILATGIPASSLSALTVRLHDWNGLLPVAAAAIPELPGVEYIDVIVPQGIPAITADLVLCAQTAGEPSCSPAVKIAFVD
ncbi:MAG TPA: hypothetical protein VM120_25475 [Bryobacteraceae bacterium]|nr:hypothetical protein [Bryobacteraceae bacterium]